MATLGITLDAQFEKVDDALALLIENDDDHEPSRCGGLDGQRHVVSHIRLTYSLQWYIEEDSQPIEMILTLVKLGNKLTELTFECDEEMEERERPGVTIDRIKLMNRITRDGTTQLLGQVQHALQHARLWNTATPDAPTLPTSGTGDELGEPSKALDDIKNGVAEILREMQQQRIEQGEVQSLLEAIRRVLGYVLKAGLPADAETKKRLDEVYQAINSNQSIQHKLEVSLPIVPSLLTYKIELEAGADIGAALEELQERLQGGKK